MNKHIEASMRVSKDFNTLPTDKRTEIIKYELGQQLRTIEQIKDKAKTKFLSYMRELTEWQNEILCHLEKIEAELLIADSEADHD